MTADSLDPAVGINGFQHKRRQVAFGGVGDRAQNRERDPLFERISAGDQAFHVDSRRFRGAAQRPPWRGRSGQARRTAARRSTTTRAPALTRRCASDAVTASSVLIAPSSETTSAPRMRSPGRSRGSSPPHRPQLTTSEGLRLGRLPPASARKVGASPQSVVRPGPARIAASRFSPQTIRTFADGGKAARRSARPISQPASSRSARATS